MSRPAEPERKNPHVGESNPAASLWDEDKPYTGPPESGQPRKGSAQKEPPLAPRIVGDTTGQK
jgi:hypothetical protein